MECREQGLRDVVDSTALVDYLSDYDGTNGYQNEAEELLLDILNGHVTVGDAIKEIRETKEGISL